MKHNPTAPPALYLTPPIIPTATARPIDYDYMVFLRKCFCYTHRFTLNKKCDRWKVKINDRENAYQIPLEKLPDEMSLILQSLGIGSRALYKLELRCGDKIINKKYFTSLTNVIRYVSDNEAIIDGVSYDVE